MKNNIDSLYETYKNSVYYYVLTKLPIEKRKLVIEITLDMANNMQIGYKMSLPQNFCYKLFSDIKFSDASIATLTNKVQM